MNMARKHKKNRNACDPGTMRTSNEILGSNYSQDDIDLAEEKARVNAFNNQKSRQGGSFGCLSAAFNNVGNPNNTKK